MVAALEFTDYFTRVFEERRAAGDLDKGDLMSIMNHAEREDRSFSPREIVVYCRFFLPAGIETTWRHDANLCYALMMHPEQFAEIVANPALQAPAIEEALRWMPSGSVLPRIAGTDCELAGVTIPKGSSMCGVFSVANRDPRIWSSPDAFDIHRDRKAHLTFSQGTHMCMGQLLARQSLQHVVRVMTAVLPDMVLAEPREALKTTGYVIRCAERVPVRAG